MSEIQLMFNIASRKTTFGLRLTHVLTSQHVLTTWWETTTEQPFFWFGIFAAALKMRSMHLPSFFSAAPNLFFGSERPPRPDLAGVVPFRSTNDGVGLGPAAWVVGRWVFQLE